MNIKNSLQIIAKHLKNYHPDLDGKVVVANISGESGAVPGDSVVITLIKVEEESHLKNGAFATVNESFRTVYKNRPVFVNLYLLFASNHKVYDTALIRLSQVVEFFQSKHFFTEKDGEDDGTGEMFRIIMELQHLSLEQINYLWGFLGGKQLPSVMYRARLIPIEAPEKVAGEGPPIKEVQIDGSTTTN